MNLATFTLILLHLIEEHIDFFLHAEHVASLTLLDFVIADTPPSISRPLLPLETAHVHERRTLAVHPWSRIEGSGG